MMTKKTFEKKLLVQVEKVTRKNAKCSRMDPEPPWPTCPMILHQPKRPKK